MASLPLERIKLIRQRIKDIVSGFVRECESSSDLDEKFEIPTSIHLVILLFYYNTIESAILKTEEVDNLLSLFNKNGKFKDLGHFEYNIIYQGTKEQFSEEVFKKNVHGLGNILCLIQTGENEVIGGYTSTGWTATYPRRIVYETDDKAFIFRARSSGNYKIAIYDVTHEKHALRVQRDYYCMFGNHCKIFCFKSRYPNQGSAGGRGGIRNHIHDYKTNGKWMDRISFDVVEMEVFQLK